MIKKITVLVVLFVVLISCTKEVGKQPYSLVFNFDSGQQLKLECLICEKSKVYNTGYGNHTISLKNSKNKIVIIPVVETSPFFEINMLKSEGSHLASLTNQEFSVNAQIIKGPLEMYGEYDKKGKKFIVENGTFSFEWTNALDYGEPIQTLTGSWSLKRK